MRPSPVCLQPSSPSSLVCLTLFKLQIAVWFQEPLFPRETLQLSASDGALLQEEVGGTPEKQEEHPTFMWPRLDPGEPWGALHCPPCPVQGAAGNLVGESLGRSSRTGRASGLQSAPARALLNADCTRGPFSSLGVGLKD